MIGIVFYWGFRLGTMMKVLCTSWHIEAFRVTLFHTRTFVMSDGGLVPGGIASGPR
jgi:hypothetical protein